MRIQPPAAGSAWDNFIVLTAPQYESRVRITEQKLGDIFHGARRRCVRPVGMYRQNQRLTFLKI